MSLSVGAGMKVGDPSAQQIDALLAELLALQEHLHERILDNVPPAVIVQALTIELGRVLGKIVCTGHLDAALEEIFRSMRANALNALTVDGHG